MCVMGINSCMRIKKVTRLSVMARCNLTSLLLLFLVIFRASLSGRDDVVLFDSCLFANDLCDIPIFAHE